LFPVPVVLLLTGLVPSAFEQGLAAGDVTDSSAVLWTRAGVSTSVTLQVARDAEFRDLVFTDRDFAAELNDWIVKFEVTGLSPQTDYSYRFTTPEGETSQVGRFRTAPPPDVEVAVRFAFSGDSNFAFGPFTLLESAAAEDADFFIWFGDTTYADVASGAVPPATELEHYRAHYRQDRGDPHLGRLLADTAVWVGWDDHEVADDYAGGDPGTYGTRERLLSAYRAFFEYMPIRGQGVAGDEFRTYRRFRYGAWAEFFLLDVRQYRDPSARAACQGALDPYDLIFGGAFADHPCIGRLRAPRTMLGAAQLAWLKQGLAESDARYKFVVSGLPMSFLGLLPYDHWDGYDAERKELLEFLDARRIQGVWFLATDAHMNGYNPDLGSYFRRHRKDHALPAGVVAREVVAGPIAQQTLRASAMEQAGTLFGDLEDTLLLQGAIHVMYLDLIDGLADLNRLAFIETDRYAYALFEIGQDGALTLTFKGLEPTAAFGPAPAARTIFTTTVGKPGQQPCGALPFGTLAGTLLALSAAGRLRR